MTRLKGKVALVTGAGRGIGQGIAERLAADGATVIVNYPEDAAEAQAVVASIEARGGRAWAMQADVTRLAEICAMFSEVDRQFGRLDILINNAGIGVMAPLEQTDEATFDRLFAVNAKGMFFVTQEAVRRMASGGKIVNVSSSTTFYPIPNSAAYASSKGVARTLTEALAKELGSRGINVNTVVPGPTEPGLFARAPESLRQIAIASSPQGRLGHPRDIAAVVSFLVSDDANWISGQYVIANGGASL
jgi:3-oxoacyl-[acyl-carrier protein] reductase